jgi:glutaredoxin
MKLQKTLIILSILSILLFAGCKKEDSKYDAFAQCLSQSGAVMYGTDWCPHCKAQKEMFGASFKFVNFVNCDKNSAACAAAGVTGYPTWVINNANYGGTQPLYKLSELSNCSLGE